MDEDEAWALGDGFVIVVAVNRPRLTVPVV